MSIDTSGFYKCETGNKRSVLFTARVIEHKDWKLTVDNKDIATFQVKGNTTSSLSNLKIEGTEKGAAAARLGKAPLALVAKLTAGSPYKKQFENKNSSFPTNSKEFETNKKKYAAMFKSVNKSPVETQVKDEKQFISNVGLALFTYNPPPRPSEVFPVTNKWSAIKFASSFSTIPPPVFAAVLSITYVLIIIGSENDLR